MICAGCGKEINKSYTTSDYNGNYCEKCFPEITGYPLPDVELDVVRVIRCKDCVYFHHSERGIPYCNRIGEPCMTRLPDDFCSGAVRKIYNKN